MIRSVPMAVALLLTTMLAGCGSSESGGDGSSLQVSADQFGKKWPLTVEEGTLRCDGSGGFGAVIFEANGRGYGVNGVALGQDYPDIDPIWKDDPELKGLKINIGPLLDRGLALCD